MFESHNGGASWTDVTGDLPDAPVFKLVLAGGRLVVGTEVGAYVAASTPTPTTWQQLGSGLPNVTVWDLTVTPDGASVVAGTHGRGRLADPAALRHAMPGVLPGIA